MTLSEKTSGSIGIFDSGFGGLTVLKALIHKLPEESYTYLGDSARLPYGTKSKATIRKYLQQNIAFLIQHGVKAIVVACNSASSVLLAEDDFAVPVFGVIEPGARVARETTSNGKIGVIGTRATVQADSYVRAIQAADQEIEVFQQACPLFVPLVEEGLEEDPLTNLIVHRYLNPLLLTDIDTLILGCTHYPVLRNSFEKVVRGRIQLVDSGQAVAEDVYAKIIDGSIPRSGRSEAQLNLWATDTASSFSAVAQKIMAPVEIPALEHIEVVSPI